jgi:hypothetical protein
MKLSDGGYMKKIVLATAILVAVTMPAWAQRSGRGPSPAASNKGGQVTGLSRAEQVQSNNPTGKAATGLATAEQKAAPEAGGQGQGAAHAKKSKHKGKK